MWHYVDLSVNCKLEDVLDAVKLESDCCIDDGEGDVSKVSADAVLQDILGMEADWVEKPMLFCTANAMNELYKDIKINNLS